MALEHFFYGDTVDCDELKELILRAAIADLTADDMARVVTALLKAYWALVECGDDEGNEAEVSALDGKEAEDFYRKVYVKKFSTVFPNHLDPDDPEVSWADSLAFYKVGEGYEKAKLFPVWLVKTVALAAAEHDISFLKEVARYNCTLEAGV